jgi:8-oxo-dGTP diphosphatase
LVIKDNIMTRYVAGLLFTPDESIQLRNRVALIRKKRPEWQAGKLNGIGGHIEEGEAPSQAMRREFKEEAGAETEWRHFCTMATATWEVYWFVAFDNVAIQSLTDEPVEWYDVDDLNTRDEFDTIPNLKWLIPLALDKDCDVAYVYMN